MPENYVSCLQDIQKSNRMSKMAFYSAFLYRSMLETLRSHYGVFFLNFLLLQLLGVAGCGSEDLRGKPLSSRFINIFQLLVYYKYFWIYGKNFSYTTMCQNKVTSVNINGGRFSNCLYVSNSVHMVLMGHLCPSRECSYSMTHLNGTYQILLRGV